MRRLFASRAALYLIERALSVLGGLAFTALLVRREAPETAAAFLAAYAFASLFQPLFANACSPTAIRLWRQGGAAALLTFWAGLQAAALAVTGAAALTTGGIGALLLLHAAAGPMALFSAPLIAEDRYRASLAILIPVGLTGALARLAALLIWRDLEVAALLYAVEPVLGGALLAARSGLRLRFRPDPEALRALARAAPPMMLAMAAATLFWRSPVLLAEAFLTPQAVIAIAVSMQVVTGLSLPANALTQSLFGPMAQGRAGAEGAAIVIAVAAGAAGVAFIALFGEMAMGLVYGPTGAAAAGYALRLAPLAGLAALWRTDQMAAGLSGRPLSLAAVRAVALAGQGALALGLAAAPSPLLIAVVTPLSLAASAVAAPLVLPALRKRAAAPSLRETLRLLLNP